MKNHLIAFILITVGFPSCNSKVNTQKSIQGEWKLQQQAPNKEVIYRFDEHYMQIEEVEAKTATTYRYELITSDTIKAYYSYVNDKALKYILETPNLKANKIQHILDSLHVSWNDFEVMKKAGLVEIIIAIHKIASDGITFVNLSSENPDTLQLTRTQRKVIIDPNLNKKLQHMLRQEKFTHTKLKELLLSIQNLPMYKQQSLLWNIIEEWKGDSPQLEDILIAGVKI